MNINLKNIRIIQNGFLIMHFAEIMFYCISGKIIVLYFGFFYKVSRDIKNMSKKCQDYVNTFEVSWL